jgi:hypothetical protein
MAKAKKSYAGRERPQAGERTSNLTAEMVRGQLDQREAYIDRLLDDALEQTFPASDAVAVVLMRSR